MVVTAVFVGAVLTAGAVVAAELDTTGVDTEEVVTIVATTAMLVIDELREGGGAAVLADAEAGARPSVTSGGFALVSVEREEGFTPGPT